MSLNLVAIFANYYKTMSTSEQDVSDSNLESPFSQSDSPYSSPSHQVPQLANIISDLSCAENTNMPKGKQKKNFL